ncbi:MAG: hypothetical protein K5776_07940 [Lachnospiraceae bacterium]|nr:hypothetical protein [Lachnospiraceae bacterium]
MTNKEKYKQAFSVLHTSENFSPEVEMMEKISKKNKIKGIVAGVAAVLTVSGLSTTAYAANLGGIQRQIQLWIHGDQTTATMEIDQGNYTISYVDENGEAKEMHGGGVSLDAFGRERPVTEEEIMDHLDMPDVAFNDDGTIIVYYHAQTIDITDKFNSDGFCFTHVTDGKKNFYMTIKNDGSYGIDSDKYPDTSEFR